MSAAHPDISMTNAIAAMLTIVYIEGVAYIYCNKKTLSWVMKHKSVKIMVYVDLEINLQDERGERDNADVAKVGKC